MRVAAFVPYSRNTPHYETQLELLQNHLDAGDEVIMLGCNADLPVCDTNYKTERIRCVNCISRRNNGVAMLTGKVDVRSFLNLTAADKAVLATLQTQFSSLEELQAYEVQGFDLGSAVASSLISYVRDPKPDLNEHAALIRDFITGAYTVYRSITHFLASEKIDRIYLFNGRYAPLRAAYRAIQEAGTPCYIHEIGHTIHHYGVWVGKGPHDIGYAEQRIREQWANADAQVRQTEGSRFFEERLKGPKIADYNFTEMQEAGRLPANWDQSRQNIIIFNSSEDEFAAISGEWRNPVYKDQLSGIQQIVASFDVNPPAHTHIYLRLHPNLRGVQNHWLDAIMAIKSPHLTTIPAEATISSYDLLRSADKVITFGSTMGIEAVFWGIPSISLGMSYYRHMDATYNPENHADLIELLGQKLEPKDKLPALMFGYYFSSYGIPFKHFEPENLYHGRFKGEFLRPSRWSSELRKWSKRVPLLTKLAPWALRKVIAQTPGK